MIMKRMIKMFNKHNDYKINQVVEAKQEFDMAPPILVEGIIRKFENYADGEYCELLTHTGDIKVVKTSNIIQVLVDSEAVENNEVIRSQPIIPAGGNAVDINNPGIGITPSLKFNDEAEKKEPINYSEFVKPPEEVQPEAEEQYQDELNDRPDEYKEIQHVEVSTDNDFNFDDHETDEILDDIHTFVISGISELDNRINEAVTLLEEDGSEFSLNIIKVLKGQSTDDENEGV